MPFNLGSAIFKSSNNRGDVLQFNLGSGADLSSLSSVSINGVVINQSMLQGLISLNSGGDGFSLNLEVLQIYLRSQGSNFWANSLIDNSAPIFALSFNFLDSSGVTQTANVDIINNIGTSFLTDDHAPMVLVGDTATIAVLAGEPAGLTVSQILSVQFDDNPAGAGANGTNWLSLTPEQIAQYVSIVNNQVVINTEFLNSFSLAQGWNYFPEVKIEYLVSDANGGSYVAEAFIAVMPESNYGTGIFQAGFSEYFHINIMDTNGDDVLPNTNHIQTEEFRAIKPINLHLFANNASEAGSGNQSGDNMILSIDSVVSGGVNPDLGPLFSMAPNPFPADLVANLISVVDAENGIIRFNSDYFYTNYLASNGMSGVFAAVFSINVTYTVNGGEQRTAHLLFTGSNRAPTANDQSADVYTSNIGDTVVMDVAGNDLDVDGDRIQLTDILNVSVRDEWSDRDTYRTLTPAEIQQVMSIVDGKIVVNTAALESIGVVVDGEREILHIEYRIEDEWGASDTGLAYLHIMTGNSGGDLVPDARNDNITTNLVPEIIINVLQNDTPGNGSLTIVEDCFMNFFINGVQIPDDQITRYISVVNGQVVLNTTNLPVTWLATNTVTFDYKVKDEDGDMDTATVTITVNNNGNPNDNYPDAIDDVLAPVTEGPSAVLLINVLANDIAGDGATTVKTDGFSNLMINGQLIPQGQISNYISLVGNQVRFNGSSIDVPNGQTYDISFQYTICDEDGDEDTATVYLQLVSDNNGGGNLIPVANEDSYAFAENTPPNFLFNVLANDIAGDGATTIKPNGFYNLTISSPYLSPNQEIQIPNSEISQYISIENGQVRVNVESLVPTGQALVVYFWYTICDADGDESTAKVIFKIADGVPEEENTPPYLTATMLVDDEDDIINNPDSLTGADLNQSTAGNATLVYNLNSIVTDDEGNYPITYSNMEFRNAGNAQLIDANGVSTPVAIPQNIYTFNHANGTVDFDHTHPFIQSLAKGEKYIFTLNFNATDSQGATANLTVSLVIVGANDGPQAVDVIYRNDEDDINGTGASAVFVGQTISDLDEGTSTEGTLEFNFVATDIDGDNLTYSIDPATIIAVREDGTTPFNIPSGITVNGDKFNFNPADFQSLNNGQGVRVTFEYQVSDGNGGTDTATATVYIVGTNDNTPPEFNGNILVDDEDAANPSFGTTLPDQNESINHVFNLNDAIDDADNDTLTYTPFTNQEIGYVENPDFPGVKIPVTASLNAAGQLTITNPEVLDHLNVGFNPVFTFPVTVSDGVNAPVVINVPIQILGTNDAPEDGDESTSVGYGTQPTINVLTNATDIDDVESSLQAMPNGQPTVTLNNQPISIQPNTITLNSNGTVNINYANLPPLQVGQVYQITVPYTVKDPQNGTNDSQLTINISGTPEITLNSVTFVEDEDDEQMSSATGRIGDIGYIDRDNSSINDGGLITFDLLGNNNNPGTPAVSYNGNPNDIVFSNFSLNVNETSLWINGNRVDLSINPALQALVNNVTVTGNSNGTFSFNESVLQFLPEGAVLALSVNYTVSAGGVTENGSSNVKIIGVDDRVVISDALFIDDEDAVQNAVSGDRNDAGDNSNNPAVDGQLTFEIANRITDVDNSTLTFVGVGPITAPVDIINSNGDVVGSIDVEWSLSQTGVVTIHNQSDLDALALGEHIDLVIPVEVNMTRIPGGVTIRILGTNDGPIDGNEVENIPYGSNITIDTLANSFDIDGDTVTIQSYGTPTLVGPNGAITIPSGLLVMNPNGTVTVTSSALPPLQSGQQYVITVPYTVTDGNGGTDNSTATITIGGNNNPPVITPQVFVDDEDGKTNALVAQGQVDENDTLVDDANPNILRFDLQDAVTDNDGINPLVFSNISSTATATSSNGKVITVNFTVLNGSQIQITNPDVLDQLALGETINFNVNFTVSDSINSPVSGSSIIRILGTNDGPVDGNEAQTINYGASTTINTLLNASDPDGDVVTIQSYGTPTLVGPNGPIANIPAGTITLNPNGTVTVNSSLLPPLPNGQQYVITVPYTVTDGNGGTDNSTATITINGGNNPPVINTTGIVDDEDAILNAAVGNGVVDENDSLNDGTNEQDANILRFDLKTIVSDSDGGPLSVTNVATSSVTVTFPNGSTGVVNFTHEGNGVIRVTNPEILDQLNVGQSILLPVTFTVTDGINPPVTGTTNIRILGTDDKATIDNSNFVDDEDAILQAVAGDLDDAGTINNSTTSADGVLTFNVADRVNDVDNATKVFTPITNGSMSLQVMNGNTGTGQFITVTYTLSSAGILTITNQSNLDQLAVGEYVTLPVSFVVNNTTLSANFTILGTNDGLTDGDEGPIEVLEGNSVTINLLDNAVDTDGDDVDIQSIDQLFINNVLVAPANYSQYITWNPATGQFTLNTANISVPNGTSVPVRVIYTVTDGNGATDQSVATFNVVDPNSPPMANPDSYIINPNNPIVNLPVLVNDNDPDGDPITIVPGSIQNLTIDGVPTPNNGIATINPNGTITLNATTVTPVLGAVIPIVFTYTITDGLGGSSTTTVTAFVQSPNDLVQGVSQNATTTNLDPTKVTDVSVAGIIRDYRDDILQLTPASDDVVGDVRVLTVRAEAGDAVAHSTPASQGGQENTYATTDVVITGNVFNSGDDIIRAAQGNDKITGDIETLNIEGYQGNATATIADGCSDPSAYASANVMIINNNFEMGDDEINGGSGNDQLIGDIETIAIKYQNGIMTSNHTNGVVNDNDNWFSGNVFTFGNDTLDGGGVLPGDTSNDTLTGDLRFVEIEVDGVMVTYDLSNADSYNDFMLAIGDPNSTLHGNWFNFGSDTFVFNIPNFGNDRITDLGIGGVTDTLRFDGMVDQNGDNVVNLADLSLISQVSATGSNNHVMVTFNNGNTLELMNISFVNGQLELEDYITGNHFSITF